MGAELRGRKTTGPLTDQQADILRRLARGDRQADISKFYGLSVGWVSVQTSIAAVKMGVRTTNAAVARYVTYTAHMSAAKAVSDALNLNATGEVDKHVNHVLAGIAQLLQERAGRLLPK